MIITLLNVYHILGIPIRGRLVHQGDTIDNNEIKWYVVWLMGEEDNDWEHRASHLSKACNFASLARHLRLLITSIISTFCMPRKE